MPSPPAATTLAKAAVACGLLGLLIAMLPMAAYGEPPVWWGWVDPASVDHEPKKTGFRFQIGRLLVGGAKDETDPEVLAARQALKQRRQTIFIFRAAATMLGLAGIALTIGAWRGHTEPTLLRTAGALSVLAAAWEFVVLAIAAAVLLVLASAVGAAWA